MTFKKSASSAVTMKPYKILEHTADVGLKVNGATLKELFENAAKGMFSIIVGEEKVKSKKSPSTWFDYAHHKSLGTRKVKRALEIKKQVESTEELLVDWLSELLYIFSKEEILFNSFKVLELNNAKIVGEARGVKIDLSQTTLQTEIKACTFHGLKIEKHKNGFRCNIIFDV